MNLSKDVDEKEIRKALFQMEVYKALGLDGFHAFFLPVSLGYSEEECN